MAVEVVGLERERGIGEGSMLAEQRGCNEAAGVRATAKDVEQVPTMRAGEDDFADGDPSNETRQFRT